MNLSKLKQAEEAFLQRYPGGFDNPEIMSIRRKKHNVDKMIAFAQESFVKRNFKLPDQIVQNMVKIVSRSSVISVFEKTRFREFADALFPEEKKLLSRGLEELLQRNEQLGFETTLELLKPRKLAKWPLMTICQTYFHPRQDVLVKPTTVKGIIQYFELKDLQYKPTPSWDFYDAYRAILHEMKSKVDESLSPTNAAFSWFLLLSFHGNLF
ncbi:MAG: hypothetical protein EHM33_12335 [Chloroflexi bacterium]|nr:MAG: hypothetical protein EHM33_12335 [Chloroflexota bacterium]